jgi:hypothetical protein
MADQFALVDCMLKQQYLWLTHPAQEAKAGASAEMPA